MHMHVVCKWPLYNPITLLLLLSFKSHNLIDLSKLPDTKKFLSIDKPVIECLCHPIILLFLLLLISQTRIRLSSLPIIK